MRLLYGALWFPGNYMGLNPGCPFGSRELTCCKLQHDGSLFDFAGRLLVAIQDQEDFPGRMPNALVPINDRMVADQRVRQSRTVLRHGRI